MHEIETIERANEKTRPPSKKVGTGTDHAAIIIEFGSNDNQVKGPGLWKMNCSILEEDSYINEVTRRIPNWVAEGQKELSDNRTIWEWIKYNIRAHAIQYSKRRAKEKSDIEKMSPK